MAVRLAVPEAVIADRPAADRYLRQHPQLVPVLHEIIRNVVAQIPGDKKVVIDIFHSRDYDEYHLRVIVRQPSYGSDLMVTLGRIWNTATAETDMGEGWLSLTTDFNFPGKGHSVAGNG